MGGLEKAAKISRRELLRGISAVSVLAGLKILGKNISKLFEEGETFQPSERFEEEKTERRESFSARKSRETFLDRVMLNGNQITVNDEKGRTRIEYVRERLRDSDKVLPFSEDPEQNEKLNLTWREEISRLIPGTFALESSFDNDSESPVGARYIVQAMPDTAEHLGYTMEELKYLKNQVSFTEDHFADAFAIVTGKIEKSEMSRESGEAIRMIREAHFDTDEDFLKFFLVPILLNAHNAGPWRMAFIIPWFAKQTCVGDMPKNMRKLYPKGYGYDFFNLMRETARDSNEGEMLTGYGPKASEYVPKAYAISELIEDREKLTKSGEV